MHGLQRLQKDNTALRSALSVEREPLCHLGKRALKSFDTNPRGPFLRPSLASVFLSLTDVSPARDLPSRCREGPAWREPRLHSSPGPPRLRSVQQRAGSEPFLRSQQAGNVASSRGAVPIPEFTRSRSCLRKCVHAPRPELAVRVLGGEADPARLFWKDAGRIHASKRLLQDGGAGR